MSLKKYYAMGKKIKKDCIDDEYCYNHYILMDYNISDIELNNFIVEEIYNIYDYNHFAIFLDFVNTRTIEKNTLVYISRDDEMEVDLFLENLYKIYNSRMRISYYIDLLDLEICDDELYKSDDYYFFDKTYFTIRIDGKIDYID